MGLSATALSLPPFVEVGDIELSTERVAPSQVVVPCSLIMKVVGVIEEAFISELK